MAATSLAAAWRTVIMMLPPVVKREVGRGEQQQDQQSAAFLHAGDLRLFVFGMRAFADRPESIESGRVLTGGIAVGGTADGRPVRVPRQFACQGSGPTATR